MEPNLRYAVRRHDWRPSLLEIIGERTAETSKDPAVAEKEILERAARIMDQLGHEPPVLLSVAVQS